MTLTFIIGRSSTSPRESRAPLVCGARPSLWMVVCGSASPAAVCASLCCTRRRGLACFAVLGCAASFGDHGRCRRGEPVGGVDDCFACVGCDPFGSQVGFIGAVVGDVLILCALLLGSLFVVVPQFSRCFFGVSRAAFDVGSVLSPCRDLWVGVGRVGLTGSRRSASACSCAMTSASAMSV